MAGSRRTSHPKHTPASFGPWAAPGQLLVRLTAAQVPAMTWATLFYPRVFGKVPRPFQTAGKRRALRHPENSRGLSGQSGAHRQLEPLPVQVSGRLPWPPALPPPPSFTGPSSGGGTMPCSGAVVGGCCVAKGLVSHTAAFKALSCGPVRWVCLPGLPHPKASLSSRGSLAFPEAAVPWWGPIGRRGRS